MTAFTDQERVDIRRYCWFGLFGANAVQAFGYRFFQNYGTLEYRMTNASSAELDTVRNKYLNRLCTLECDLYGTSQNLDTASAAVWVHNPKEMKDRVDLYTWWRKSLCEFYGILPGPQYQNTNSIRLVV